MRTSHSNSDVGAAVHLAFWVVDARASERSLHGGQKLCVCLVVSLVGNQVCVFASSHVPFCPQTCNASFATRDRLRSHLACHEDKVPCQVCGKYLRAAYMADHLKKHSEGPSNFCSICNRGNPPAIPSLGLSLAGRPGLP